MPCVLLLLLLVGPRVVIVLLAIFGDYIGDAYSSLLWPIVGFFCAPFFTLAYAWSIHEFGAVQGLGLAAVILAALLDLGVIGSSAKKKR